MKSLLSGLLISASVWSSGQVNPAWEKWIQTNSHDLSLADTNNFNDLSFLKEVLKDKRIVFLGENSHGVSEFTTLKSRMVRYLHDSLEFDVLAFESNAGDAYYANSKITGLDTRTSIYNSLSSLWHVEEIVPLFNYIKKTHSSKKPLIVSGVDFIGSNGSYSFSRFLCDLILPINPEYAKEVKTIDSLYTRAMVLWWTTFRVMGKEKIQNYYEQAASRLSFYTKLADFIGKNEEKFSPKTKQDVVAAKKFLQDKIDNLHWSIRDSLYMVNQLPCRRGKLNLNKLWSKYRDYEMQQQLKFLFSTLYAGKKIIVWAQDSHIYKSNCHLAADTSYSQYVYTIALQSYSGKGCYVMSQKSEHSASERQVYEFKTPNDSLFVENIIHSANNNITFIDMMYQKKCNGNSWMFDKSKWTEWEGGNERETTENIRSLFDGLILVNKITPPHYLNFNYEYLQKK